MVHTTANIPAYLYIKSMRIREHLIQLRQTLNQCDWIELAEYASLACSAVGSVVAVVTQQVAYAALPLTLALSLNSIEQKRRAKRHSADFPSALNQVYQRFIDLDDRLQSLPKPVEIDLVGIHDELAKFNKSLTIIEGKAAFMSSKVYDNLSVQINTLRKQIEEVSEPFDLTKVESQLATLKVAVQFLSQRPVVDPQEYEKLYRLFLQLEANHREFVMPFLQRLEREIQGLHSADINLNNKLDQLGQKFSARPEQAQLSKLGRMVARLSDSVNQIQQTEVIAALYEEIGQLSQQLNRVNQGLKARPEHWQMNQLLEMQQTQMAQLEQKLNRAIAALGDRIE